MAYVVMHDTGNFWLIDDLCTDAEPAVAPVPGRGNWFTENCFDLVFVPDEDYGSAADVAKWLPTFLAQVNSQIDKRLGGFSPVSGHLDKFNFYYTTLQGLAGTFPRSRQHIIPEIVRQAAPFADAFVILHKGWTADFTYGSGPALYSGEGPLENGSKQSAFLHESGHAIFGLARVRRRHDRSQPDAPTGEPGPHPNIWKSKADGRSAAAKYGWKPDDIWKFTKNQEAGGSSAIPTTPWRGARTRRPDGGAQAKEDRSGS